MSKKMRALHHHRSRHRPRLRPAVEHVAHPGDELELAGASAAVVTVLREGDLIVSTAEIDADADESGPQLGTGQTISAAHRNVLRGAHDGETFGTRHAADTAHDHGHPTRNPVDDEVDVHGRHRTGRAVPTGERDIGGDHLHVSVRGNVEDEAVLDGRTRTENEGEHSAHESGENSPKHTVILHDRILLFQPNRSKKCPNPFKHSSYPEGPSRKQSLLFRESLS